MEEGESENFHKIHGAHSKQFEYRISLSILHFAIFSLSSSIVDVPNNGKIF